MINIDKVRSETPGVSHCVHLNNAGASLMPSPVINAINEYVEFESITGGYEAARAKEEDFELFYKEAAKLIGSSPNNIAYSTNATDAFGKALSSIPFEKGDVIITSMNDYVSNQIQFLSLNKRFGTKLIRVPDTERGGIDINALEELVRKHEPRLVTLSHIPTNSGLIQDAAAVGKVCAENDVLYILDACQSAGQLPLSVEELRCDFLAATMRKYLRGPRGVGFLFVSDKALAEGYEPLTPDMSAGEWTAANAYDLFDTAKRFEYWEKNYALMSGAAKALEYVNDIGIDNVKERAFELARYCREKVDSINGVRCYDEGDQLCAITSYFIEDVDEEIMIEFMLDKQVNVNLTRKSSNVIDFGSRKKIPWALRISPHYYNTKEEIDRCADLLEEYLSIS